MASARSCRSVTAGTGDLRNNMMKLLREVQRMKLPLDPDVEGLSLGLPSSFLPILHSSLMHYSLPLANWLTRHDYSLYSKTDLRFLEMAYKILRDVFHYHPRLTREQFLSTGFVERKVLFAIDVLCFCQAKHKELEGGRRQMRRRTGRGRREAGLQGGAHSSLKARRKPEVLTIHDTSGISSVWSEAPRVEIEVADNTHVSSFPYTPPVSPPHPPPYSLPTSHLPLYPLTPTTDLEVTPNPTPLKGKQSEASLHPLNTTSHSAAHRHPGAVPNPVSLRDYSREISGLQQLQPWPSESQTKEVLLPHPPGLVVRHPPLPPPALSSITQPSLPGRTEGHPNMAAATGTVPSMLQSASERGVPRRKLVDTIDTAQEVPQAQNGYQGRSGSGSPVSWHSLPIREENEEEEEEDEEGGGKVEEEEEGGGKVEEEEEGGGRPETQSGVHVAVSKSPLGDIGNRVEQLAQLVEKMSARFVLLETQLKMAESRRPTVGTTGQRKGGAPLTPVVEPPDGMSPVSAKPQVLAKVLPPTGSDRHLPMHPTSPTASRTVVGRPRSPHSSGDASASCVLNRPSQLHANPLGMRGHMAQLHSPLQRPLPPSPSSPSAYTTPHRLTVWSQVPTPATPEDTRQMIENLRNRAQRTRDFLRKANADRNSS